MAKVDRRIFLRKVVLALFSCMSCLNGFAWIMFDPVANVLQEDFSPYFDSSQLALLSSWHPILYIAVAPIITRFLVSPNGLQNVMRVGSVLEMLASSVKLLAFINPHSHGSLAALHIGQIISATTSPIVIGSPAYLSAMWFPEEQRASATGVGVLANNVGNCLAYVLVPAMALKFGFMSVVLLEFALSLCTAVAVLCACPRDPKRKRILTDEEDPVNVIQETKALLTMPYCVLICIVYMWSSGGYVAWTSLFDDLLDTKYDDEFIGVMSAASTATYVFGGMIASVLADTKWKGRLKEIILGSCVAGFLSCLLVSLSMPLPFGPGATPINAGRGWLVFAVSLSGFFNGAAAPIFYEVIAEMAFPVSEGVSGNVLSYFENIGALVIYQLVRRVASGTKVNIVFTVGMAVTIACVAGARVRYFRTEAEEEAAKENDPGVISESVHHIDAFDDRSPMRATLDTDGMGGGGGGGGDDGATHHQHFHHPMDMASRPGKVAAVSSAGGSSMDSLQQSLVEYDGM